MRFCLIIATLLLCSPLWNVSGQSLPEGATVLEEQSLPRHRKLVLWMPDAVKHPYENGDIYTCPDMSRGSFYSGDVRVTLINAITGRVINTLDVKGNGDSVDPRPTS